ncbi:MAG TPA: LLM class flavin-dependent oxidoreductase [Acidimicrobiales bacterium]|nr:LLM class flavin-dependent oxidoreductase [Acidimicrobiales bacterium]
MRVGITLPQFRDEADTALEAARRAESLGIDGVFCFDHLWPMGQPGRPALSSGPLLGALAASTATISLGTLVARIGLVPDEVLVEVLCSVHELSGGRFIAGIGTGDHLSRDENDAYGLPFDPADERRARLVAVATEVTGRGIPVWVRGGLPKTVELARTVGAAVNLWQGDPLRVAELTAVGMEVTWGGPAGESGSEATERLSEVARAGATWAVCAWPDSLEVIAEAAEAVRGTAPWAGR